MNHGRDCGCNLCMEYGGTRSWEEAQQNKPQPMPEARLAEIEARVNAASPGPWRCGPINYADIYSKAVDGPIALVVKDEDTSIRTVPDADFIIHARMDIPDLIAEIRRLKELSRKI